MNRDTINKLVAREVALDNLGLADDMVLLHPSNINPVLFRRYVIKTATDDSESSTDESDTSTDESSSGSDSEEGQTSSDTDTEDEHSAHNHVYIKRPPLRNRGGRVSYG